MYHLLFVAYCFTYKVRYFSIHFRSKYSYNFFPWPLQTHFYMTFQFFKVFEILKLRPYYMKSHVGSCEFFTDKQHVVIYSQLNIYMSYLYSKMVCFIEERGEIVASDYKSNDSGHFPNPERIFVMYNSWVCTLKNSSTHAS